MSEATQEMWIKEFQQMAKGHRSYHHQFYQLSHKSSDEQSGGGSNKRSSGRRRPHGQLTVLFHFSNYN